MWRRLWFRWVFVFLGWTCIALFFASQTYLSYKYSGGVAHWRVVLTSNLCQWYGWGLLAPGIIWLARRFPFERGRWAASVAVHMTASVGVSLVKWQLDNFLRHHVLGFERGTSLISGFHQSLVTYWLLVGRPKRTSTTNATAKASCGRLNSAHNLRKRNCKRCGCSSIRIFFLIH